MKPTLRELNASERCIRGNSFYWQNSEQCVNDPSYSHAEQWQFRLIFNRLPYICAHPVSRWNTLEDDSVSGFCSTAVTQVGICFLCPYEGEMENIFLPVWRVVKGKNHQHAKSVKYMCRDFVFCLHYTPNLDLNSSYLFRQFPNFWSFDLCKYS